MKTIMITGASSGIGKETAIEQYPDGYKDSFRKWQNYLMKNFKNGYSPELDAKII